MADLKLNDRTAEFGTADVNANRAMGVLSYIGILVLVPIFAAKNSKFARFHANQGLVLLIAQAIICTAVWIVGGLLMRIPYVGWLFGTVSWLISVAVYVPSVFGIVDAARGKAREFPVTGNFRILK